MPGKIYFQFISSFFMGVFAGFFLYVTVYAPAYKSDIAPDELNSSNSITIEGKMYGGCSETGNCASFRLLENRTYNYLSFPEADVEKGALPNDMSKAIFDAVGTDEFFDATEEFSPDNCASYVDGFDFEYEVMFDNDTYVLDTCSTALSQNEQLQQLFINAWEFMQNPTTTYPVLIEEGIGGFLRDRFQQSGE